MKRRLHPLRVAVFTDNDLFRANGVTTTLRALLAHAPPEIQPRIYTCGPDEVDRPDWFTAGAFGIGLPFCRDKQIYCPPVARLLRQARQDRVGLVHLTTPGPVGLVALYVSAELGIPMVGSLHIDLAEYTRWLSGSRRLAHLMERYLRWPYGKCHRVLVPSIAARDTLIRQQIDPAKIGLWKRGVSTDVFSPTKYSAALRDRWGASDQRPVLLYVGRVAREKGLDLLPALTERLQRSGFKHRLVVVGEGPMREPLSDRCTGAVFTGALTHEEVAVAMASADLFVFPSQTDTAGNVVLEAQASGLPVLVPDVGGSAEHMVDGVTGYVCHDSRCFARHVTDVLGGPLRRNQMSQAARRYAEQRQWPEALNALYRAYREVAQPSGVDESISLGTVLAT